MGFDGQNLPHATGEGGAGSRVKSAGGGEFSAISEQQNGYLSEDAVAESLAALGGLVFSPSFCGVVLHGDPFQDLDQSLLCGGLKRC